ncbi:repressor LexA [bacterium (Candidatus Torokbacteria) CG_4_10_14_0_2_um_filter_35_8]|nr:MAG: repressor LexA [bacterium (Candidatus Torokbacteria) CG_4_10_14_0_2_um_filter_35_8]
MNNFITKKQKKILDYLKKRLSDANYSPTYREMSQDLSLSPSTIWEHIKALKEKDFIKDETGLLELTKRVYEKDKTMNISLVGVIAAGKPIEAIEEYETIAVSSKLLNNANLFALKVSGDSMVEDGIFDGDFVVVERNFYPRNGDIVVALLNNQYATLKKYYREKNRIRLQPANAKMKPIFAKNPSIRGIVKAIIRKF